MNRQSNRAGYTLVELLAVISIGSMLMLLAVCWIGETMKFASRTTNHLRQHQQLTQLSRNFRTDVRLSQSMTIDDDRRLVLEGYGGQQVIYSFSESTINRERQSGSQVSRERYPLVSGSQIEWDTSGFPDSIGLVITRSNYLPKGPKPGPVADRASSGDDARSLTSSDTMPVDIHIFANVKRWAVKFSNENNNGGGP